MSESQQTIMLSRFAYELTVLARETYGPSPSAITNCMMLRGITELQHRIAAAILARLCGTRERFPDEVLVRMSADPADNPLALSTGPLFTRILAEMGGTQRTHESAGLDTVPPSPDDGPGVF
jgi:hypothetical protein